MTKPAEPLTVKNRPARPALLSPIPFSLVALNRRELIFNALIALLTLLAAAALLVLLPIDPADPSLLIVPLVALALLLWALAELIEHWRLMPLVPPYAVQPAGVAFVAYSSPVKWLRSLLLNLLLLASAALFAHYSLQKLWPRSDRLVMLLITPVMAALALGNLADLPRRRRLMFLQAQALAANAHRLPERGPARRSVKVSGASLLTGFLALLLTVFLAFSLKYELRHRQWDDLLISLLFLGLVLWYSPLLPRQRWVYRANGDYFCFQRRGRNLKWEEVEHYPVADYRAFYTDRTADNAGQLWLAGSDGRDDVQLPLPSYWLRESSSTAQSLAERLGAASGLPLLHRWPAPPREIFQG